MDIHSTESRACEVETPEWITQKWVNLNQEVQPQNLVDTVRMKYTQKGDKY
jgi:hypothetical protein